MNDVTYKCGIVHSTVRDFMCDQDFELKIIFFYYPGILTILFVTHCHEIIILYQKCFHKRNVGTYFWARIDIRSIIRLFCVFKIFQSIINKILEHCNKSVFIASFLLQKYLLFLLFQTKGRLCGR